MQIKTNKFYSISFTCRGSNYKKGNDQEIIRSSSNFEPPQKMTLRNLFLDSYNSLSLKYCAKPIKIIYFIL